MPSHMSIEAYTTFLAYVPSVLTEFAGAGPGLYQSL
jgi:hypothetical protein